jgi:uncharacterized protein (TIGR00299 family) protein
MKVAYLECFAGIAGDMFLGALVDAGVDPSLLQQTANSLHLDVVLEFKKVDRSGIQSTKARVLLNGMEADAVSGSDVHLHPSNGAQTHAHSHSHSHSHPHTHTDEYGVAQTHSHSHEHSESPAHNHIHGRSLSAIRKLIQTAALTANARRIALDAFAKLAAAESKIHGVPAESVHFHEVGAVDAIIDIVCSAAGADSLGVDAWYCSPVNTGSGFVDCAHGRFPVPAPATLELLRGVPIYADGPAKEFTTPTGAALLAALGCRYDPLPSFVSANTGYGAGTRNPERFPNVVRLQVGFLQQQPSENAQSKDTVTVLECAMDDATPETLAFAAHSLIEHGALDVMQQSVMMKKGRQGTLLTVLCRPQDANHLEHLIFRETTTLGIRTREEQRTILERHIISVATEFGSIRIKLGMRDGAVLNASPEFEDCRSAAEANSVALKQVMQAAIVSYVSQQKLTPEKVQEARVR